MLSLYHLFTTLVTIMLFKTTHFINFKRYLSAEKSNKIFLSICRERLPYHQEENIMCTAHFKVMSQNLTTSRVWRLKKKSTK